MTPVTVDDIELWLEEAPSYTTHMIVFTDPSEQWRRFPEYINTGDPKSYLEDLGFEWHDGGFLPNEDGMYVEECYSYSKPYTFNDQLAELRAIHYD